jgi:hypothetical protein
VFAFDVDARHGTWLSCIALDENEPMMKHAVVVCMTQVHFQRT